MKEELRALSRRSTPQALKTADKDIAAAVLRRHGNKAKDVIVTVVRADNEICAATVRFEGPVSGIGDREYVRLRFSDGEWRRDDGMGMYTCFSTSFGARTIAYG